MNRKVNKIEDIYGGMKMKLRKLDKSEYPKVYQAGYKEWPKGRTFEQYVKDNQKEEAYGTRYGYVNSENKLIASLIVLSLTVKTANGEVLPIFGLGSIVVDEQYQGNGYGKAMITECLRLIETDNNHAVFMLYSEINPSYYNKFGFHPLPKKLQKYEAGCCMVRCNEKTLLPLLSVLTVDNLPAYF